MKMAISVPDETFAAADAAAARLGLSRSQFYARAARRWLDDLADEDLTARIDASLEGVDQTEDRELARAAAARTFARSDW